MCSSGAPWQLAQSTVALADERTAELPQTKVIMLTVSNEDEELFEVGRYTNPGRARGGQRDAIQINSSVSSSTVNPRTVSAR